MCTVRMHVCSVQAYPEPICGGFVYVREAVCTYVICECAICIYITYPELVLGGYKRFRPVETIRATEPLSSTIDVEIKFAVDV